MELIITPSYSDIFEGEIPSLESLLKDIPSKLIISVLSLINAQLYYSMEFDSQMKILAILLQGQDAKISKQIYFNLTNRRKREQKVAAFSILYTTEFIHYAILNYNELDIAEISPKQQLNFVKAYFVFVEMINKNYADAYRINIQNDVDFFQKATWPTLIDQFDINHSMKPMTVVIKGLSLLKYLEYDSPYKIYVTNFLKLNQKESIWNYMLDLFNLLIESTNKTTEDPKAPYPFSLEVSPEFQSLFDNFTISTSDYKMKYNESKGNFSGLKDKPLFQFDNNIYLILNKNFLANKLYDGLLFDFYSQSGINEFPIFSSYIEFKRHISVHVIEQYLFKRIISRCFDRKHVVKLYDDKSINGFPDAYIREGKYIYLFEIKDAYFPSSAITDLDYTQIKKVIDTKYNTAKKGTGQLIKQLLHLEKSNYESKDFNELKLKRRNIIIYPIIIYTDYMFNLPGINQYLQSEFNSKIVSNDLNGKFGKIANLTFINLSYLIENINLFSNSNSKFNRFIDEYHDSIKGAEVKFKKSVSVKNLFSVNDTFDAVISKRFNTEIRYNSDTFIETIIDTLKLTEDLP